MSKILVCGGAGFIGSNLCNIMAEKGHDVTAFDNLYLGWKENLNSNVKFLTDIRNGEYTIKELEDWFISKETEVDQLYQNCKLPNRSNYKEIKDLLLNCLEEHFGNISRFYPKGVTYIYSLI